MWKMCFPSTDDAGCQFPDTGLSLGTLNHVFIPLCSYSSFTSRYVSTCQIPTTHLPSASERALSLFFLLRAGLTLLFGKTLFQKTSSQLSPDGKAQENGLCLRPGSCPLQCLSLKKAWKILQLGINQLHISIHQSVNRTSRCKCLHWSMICLILCPKFKRF